MQNAAGVIWHYGSHVSKHTIIQGWGTLLFMSCAGKYDHDVMSGSQQNTDYILSKNVKDPIDPAAII